MIFKKEIVEKLNKKLSLPFTGTEQDWDLEMANSKRIDEFLTYFKNNELTRDEKMAMMALILASFDDLLNENKFSQEKWIEIQNILKLDIDFYSELLKYWSPEIKGEGEFKISSLIKIL